MAITTARQFHVRDIVGPFDASARYFSTLGDVQIDESDDKVLTSNPEDLNQCIVRRGSRAGWYGVAAQKSRTPRM